MVSAELQTLKMALSDQNLELLPDYEQRVAVLKELRFVDDSSTVLLKGRVACEVSLIKGYRIAHAAIDGLSIYTR
jgi:antiviral helicase SKI2